MKTLYAIRHAKSSWDEPGLSDLDRPLNSRGLRDAPFMAKLLYGKDIQIDRIISSPAKRALETAEFFAKQWKIPVSQIAIERSIYEASSSRILEIARSLSNDWETVFFFGHNPTFTAFINMFSKEYLANLPTCGIARIEVNTADWSGMSEKNTSLAELYYPKQYFP